MSKQTSFTHVQSEYWITKLPNRRVRRSSRLTGHKRRLGGSEGEDDGTAGLSDSDVQDLYDDDGDEEYGAAGLEEEGDGDSAWSSSGLEEEEEEDEGSGEVGPVGCCWSLAMQRCKRCWKFVFVTVSAERAR